MRAAKSDSFAVLWFRGGRDNPPGMTVDSATGLVQWTPTIRGWYTITVHAFTSPFGHAQQSFIVGVTSGNGVIQGKVSDSLGAGIAGITVELFQSMTPMLDGPSLFTYRARTDVNGYYQIPGIDPGSYKLRAVSYLTLFASQWYDGKSGPMEANTIIVADAPQVTMANFTLRAGAHHLPHFTASGTVTDSADLPLRGSMVYFVRSGFVLNRISASEDFRAEFDQANSTLDLRIDGASQHVFRRMTDTLGMYSLSLPQGEYIAFARALGHKVEFYKETSDFLSATRIQMDSDQDSIDFTLSPRPPIVYGSIEGSVYDSSNQVGVRSRIIAWNVQWTLNATADVRHAFVSDTDSTGAYVVAGLPPGSYVVLAVPLGSYAPSFYTSDSLSMRWRTATRIAINGTTVSGITIYVKPIPTAFSGYAAIRGTVRLGVASESGSAGTIVFVRRNGAVAGYAVTDVSGSYAIDGLAPGTYSVEADRVGYTEPPSKSVSVAYSSTGEPVDGSAEFQIVFVTSVDPEEHVAPAEFGIAQNYPNPFNPSTRIEYSVANAGYVTIRVFNLLGQEVGTLVDGVQNAGTRSVVFDAKGLPSGIYFCRMEQAGQVQTRRMVLMR